MAEELGHLVADIEAGAEAEAEAGTGTGSVAGTMSEAGCTEPGSRPWGSSCHLDRRKGSESGHRRNHWRPGRRERLSEGSWKVWLERHAR